VEAIKQPTAAVI